MPQVGILPGPGTAAMSVRQLGRSELGQDAKYSARADVSASPPKSDIARYGRHFAFGPDPDLCCEFKKAWRAGEVSTLASHGITPVEHDDDSEHRSGIDDLRYVIQNNGEALSAGVPKFLMSVARQYRHQA